MTTGDMRNVPHLTLDVMHSYVEQCMLLTSREPAAWIVTSEQDAALARAARELDNGAPESFDGKTIYGVPVRVAEPERPPQPEPESALPAGPDLIQPVIGYRGWNTDGATLISAGAVFGVPWKTGVNVARCMQLGIAPEYVHALAPGNPPPGHDSPHPECACGLYGYIDLRSNWDGGIIGIVAGAIAAWGRIEVHATGFRAQYARIVALGLPEYRVLGHPDYRRQVDEVADRYGVPAVPLIDLEAEAREHGIVMPEELRPEPELSYDEFSGSFHSGGVVASGSHGLWQLATSQGPLHAIGASAQKQAVALGRKYLASRALVPAAPIPDPPVPPGFAGLVGLAVYYPLMAVAMTLDLPLWVYLVSATLAVFCGVWAADTVWRALLSARDGIRAAWRAFLRLENWLDRRGW